MAEPDPAIILRRAPPANVAEVVRPGLSCRMEQGLGIAKLRISGTDADARFRAVAGIPAPRACTQTETEALAFGWLAPGEWLVTGSESAVADWVTRIYAVGAPDLLAIDFSHARAGFLLEGANARVALAGHCPLDLWENVFSVGSVARSLLGDTGAFIARLPDKGGVPQFRLIVDQTMAAYTSRLFATCLVC
jgi:sarcosine oxidase subunit gamma